MTVMIGIDPHKATHTAVAIDGDERPLARLQLTTADDQTVRLLAWAAPLGPEQGRTWAVESAGGLGKLLTQQLLDAGEQVVDVPPTLSARVRLLGSAKASKNDDNDALATAIAGLRHCGFGPCDEKISRGDPSAGGPLRGSHRVAHPGGLPAARGVAGAHRWWSATTALRRPGRHAAAWGTPRRCRRGRAQAPRPRAPGRCPPSRSGHRHRPATGHYRRPRLGDVAARGPRRRPDRGRAHPRPRR